MSSAAVTSARLSHLFVHVASLTETRQFSVDLLGLELLVEEPGYLRIGNADGWHIGMEEGEPIGAEGIELVIRVPDVDASHARLTDAGVSFETPPIDTEGGFRHAWLRGSNRLPAQHLFLTPGRCQPADTKCVGDCHLGPEAAEDYAARRSAGVHALPRTRALDDGTEGTWRARSPRLASRSSTGSERSRPSG